MNFNSLDFSIFFIVVLFLYSLVFFRNRSREILLLVASYFFYMSWNWTYAGLIALSTVVDYFVGLRMDRESIQWKRRALLIVSLVVNLGILGLFKYYNFFADMVTKSMPILGFEVDFTPLNILLPVGISFYTFQTLSYTIDLYRREISVERDLVKFAVFVSFFPQLVAGPIVRAGSFLPQLHSLPNVSKDRTASGILLIFRGLFKKIIIADLLASLAVDQVFSSPGNFSSWDLLMALYGYSFQIYNDFSGYSDIAIGIARILGFDLGINFNRPYQSQNVREFWTRWHISLSSWLRDYLYIPLGGNKGTRGRVSFNLMLTMLLGGLWHGAAINFVVWGFWHGLLLIFARSSRKNEFQVPISVQVRRTFLCFHLIVFSWLLFRIGTFEMLLTYISGLVKFSSGTQIQPLYYAILIGAALVHFSPKDRLDEMLNTIANSPRIIQAGFYASLIIVFIGCSLGAPAFIYFQF